MRIEMKITGTTNKDYSKPMNQFIMGKAFNGIYDALKKVGINNISVEFQQMEPMEAENEQSYYMD